MSKRKPNQLTLAEHDTVADHLAVAHHHLSAVATIVSDKFYMNQPVWKAVYKLCPPYMRTAFSNLQHRLDSNWCNVAPRSAPEPYFNCEDRYEGAVERIRQLQLP